MFKHTRIFLITFLPYLCLLSLPSYAKDSLQIIVIPPSLYEIASGTIAWKIYLDGVIEPGADQRVEREITEISDAVINVYLNSPGGDFLTGIKLGRLFRAKSVWTHIARQSKDTISMPGICFSACALAYLGGYYRFGTNGSKYGVHRTWKDGVAMNADFDIGQLISATTAAYIREMGVDGRLLDLTVAAGRDQLHLLRDQEQIDLNVVNQGRAAPEWSLQMQKGILYLRGSQNTMYGMGKFILYCAEHNLILHSIYEAGTAKSESVARGGWFHSLSIDGETIALGTPIRISNIDGYLNVMFHLSPEQTRHFLNARESVGHMMQLSREAPTFLGYKVDFTSETKSQHREFVSSCLSSK